MNQNSNPQAADVEPPIPKWAIWVMCLVLTPLCGAIMYYAWKKTNLPAANLANRISWISWFIWIGGWALLQMG